MLRCRSELQLSDPLVDELCQDPIIEDRNCLIGQTSERLPANKILPLPTPSSLLHSLRAQFIVGSSSHPLVNPLLRAPEHDSPCEVAGAEEASDDISFLTNVATYCCEDG